MPAYKMLALVEPHSSSPTLHHGDNLVPGSQGRGGTQAPEGTGGDCCESHYQDQELGKWACLAAVPLKPNKKRPTGHGGSVVFPAFWQLRVGNCKSLKTKLGKAAISLF